MPSTNYLSTMFYPDSTDERREGFSKGCVKFYHENYYEEQLIYEPLPLPRTVPVPVSG